MRPGVRKLVTGLSYGYRPVPGPLQNARVEVTLAWFGALLTAAMLFDNPLALAAVLAAVLVTAGLSGALARLRFTLVLALPIALMAAVVNPLVVRDGATVVIEGVWLPLLGTFDVSLEAIVYGLILGLRAFTVVTIAALYVAVVDPDEVLRMLRRFSVRSAITATLASRLVPLLARDGLRMAAARECRPGDDPGRVAIVRSVFARSFERTEDAALALELRGYSHARRRRPVRRRFSAGEWGLLAGAAALVVLSVTLMAFGVLAIDPYPVTRVGLGAADFAGALLLLLTAIAPVAVGAARARLLRVPA